MSSAMPSRPRPSRATTDHLVVDSVAELELDATAWPVFDVAASAASYPFPYPIRRRADLGALAVPQYPDPTGRLRVWAEGFVRSRPTDTLSLLKDLSAGVAALGLATRAARTKARSRRSRRSIAAGARAATSPCCSSRRRAAWASAPASCRAICTIRRRETASPSTTHAWAEVYRAGRRLDHLRSDQSLGRRLQPDPRRGRARHPPGDAGGGQLRRHDRRVPGLSVDVPSRRSRL